MISFYLSFLALLGNALAISMPSINLGEFSSTDTFTTDVLVIGGGSSGTHAAIGLKDAGFSTLILEQSTHLGGHTETYFDEQTKTSWDYGVLIFHNTDVVKRYFSRLNTTIEPSAFQLNRVATNMKNGKPVNATIYSQEEIQTALQTYAKIISQWPELDRGLYLPEPVPEDLILPFSDFLRKYKCEAVMPLVIQFNVGAGDILTMPTVEMIRIVGLSLLRSFQAGFLQVPDGDTSKLYRAAEEELKSSNSLILSARVTYIQRTNKNGVVVVVETPQGCKLVIAKRLVVAVPPKLEIVGDFDIDMAERDVFSKFVNTGYYTALLRNTGLPWNVTLYNADPNRPYAYPDLPSVSSVGHAGVAKLHGAFYQTDLSTSTQPLSDGDVKAEILSTIERLQASGIGTVPIGPPEFVRFSSHSPFYLQVGAESIKNGFYKTMYALQGRRNTFWTGAAWRAHDSSAIWRFNEEVLVPAVIKSLEA